MHPANDESCRTRCPGEQLSRAPPLTLYQDDGSPTDRTGSEPGRTTCPEVQRLVRPDHLRRDTTRTRIAAPPLRFAAIARPDVHGTARRPAAPGPRRPQE